MHEIRPNPIASEYGYWPRPQHADLVQTGPGLTNLARSDEPEDLGGGHRAALDAARIARRSTA